MTEAKSESPVSAPSAASTPPSAKQDSGWWSLTAGVSMLALAFMLRQGYMTPWRSTDDPSWNSLPTPLVMKGGDPYIRALMRTISASESHSPRPYSLLYGGEHFQDFSQHPDICVPIEVGPNTGNCSTAAGRYQFITTTWEQVAADYHSNPGWFWHQYRFDPIDQDEVVYRWLSDPQAWGGADLSALLRAGQIDTVLQILSPTWTSLGYGIETNSMSAALPQIYQEMLREEL